MPTYQVFPLAVTEAKEFTVEGGTEAEWLAKTTEEPANPSTVVQYKSLAKATCKLRVSLKIAGTDLDAALARGEKVVGIKYHFSDKNAAVGKTVRFGAVTPEDIAEPEESAVQTWYTVTATDAHARELTKAKLEELRLLCDVLLAKTASIYEIYATVTTEAVTTPWQLAPPTLRTPSGLYKPFPIAATERAVEEAVLKGKAEGSLLLTGTSKGIAAQVVRGIAAGALLLTGTSKGVAIQKVLGSATGTLLLTGTSKATLASVLKGNATGALLLTGTSKGIAAQRISGQAAGALLLTGASKGEATTGLRGKATGTLLLTGSAVATLAEVKLGKASGTLFLLGSGKGEASEKAGKIAIFIFDE